MNNNSKLIFQVGTKVFLEPTPLYDYETLVIKSLSSNTYRAFHKIDKNKDGAKFVFEKILNEKKELIITSLNKAKDENDLDSLEIEICNCLKYELKKNIINKQLDSFNKLRKPIDIVIEHLLAMGNDFTNESRKILIPHLYLPLDSQMFKSSYVFSDEEAKEMKIRRNFSFKDIESETHYKEIQCFLKGKANKIKIENRIFFDLVWNDRFLSNGTNLLSTNPK